MDVFQVGIDHHRAPLDVRARLALDGEQAAALARRCVESPWAEEAFVLATCNRTELYVVSAAEQADRFALDTLLEHLPEAPPPSEGLYREQSGGRAAWYLMRVACGLESAILGETEIQGQVKTAFERARDAGTAGPVLDRLVGLALRAGKEARTRTKISAGGVSHGSAALRVIDQLYDDLRDREVLVVGAGDIAAQAARALVARGVGRFVIANRSRDRAARLVEELGQGETHGLESIPERLARAHVAVLARGGEPISYEVVSRSLSTRREPLLLIDLGMPRGVDAAVQRLPGVFLYDLEAIEGMVQEALAERRQAVGEVDAIIEQSVEKYRAWLRARSAIPAIQSLNSWAEAIRLEEFEFARRHFGIEDSEALEHLSRRIVKRLLGRAAERVVKGAQEQDPSFPTADHLRHVFGLEERESE